MDSRQIKPFPEQRGMAKDARDPDDDPYSPESYAAQYGISLDDAEEIVGTAASHGDVMREIQSTYLRDGEFRTRSLGMMADLEAVKRGVDGPLTDEGFERPATILKKNDVEYQRRFFRCDKTDEELDQVAQEMAENGEGWLKRHDRETRRIYVMARMFEENGA